MYFGQCLCGQVSYRVKSEFVEIECCHCLTCRKAHSSAFAMGVTIDSADFELQTGQELLKEYESSTGKKRVFCGQCGSHLYAYRVAQPESVRLRPACLNIDMSSFKYSHIYTENCLRIDSE
ncbi:MULTISPECIES: GFA family protein [unclassified Endozoicomonas]|uniref:GFA family protein n=1 Tax=unclassified Endozoicomonas TaxID=2644528 RepID=UPI0021486408|nr:MULTISPECIES: GFA family protein [unclassified Endozoicomonas]